MPISLRVFNGVARCDSVFPSRAHDVPSLYLLKQRSSVITIFSAAVEGRERLRTLNLQHGCFTAEMKAGSRIGKLKLRYLEDFAIYSGLFTERTRGRKPLGYMRLNPRIPSQLELLKEIVGYSSP
jgi:hypothetical protein